MVFETAYLHNERMNAMVHSFSDEPSQHHCMRGNVTHYNNNKSQVTSKTSGYMTDSQVPGQNFVAVRVGVFMMNSLEFSS